MKNHFKLSMLVSIAAVLSLVSCGKYEDGPEFSLRSKKSRLVNTWVIEKALQNGVDFTADFRVDNPDYQLEIRKDNSFVSITYDSLLALRDEVKGTWKFMDDKDEVEFTDGQTGQQSSEKILRLTNTELWTEMDFGFTKIELHYKEK